MRTPLVVYTIGHSTRPIADFVSLLQAHAVARVIDVRKIPQSRRHPQFGKEQLAAALARAEIDYRHLPELGGLRRPRRDSINTAWQNDSFRGYADYMQTPEFAAAIDDCLKLAAERPSAVMCAEAVPWRCHRRLIADALVARGVEVMDIIDANRPTPHQLSPWARVDGVRVSYPGPGTGSTPLV